jgi:lipoprotein NlpI
MEHAMSMQIPLRKCVAAIAIVNSRVLLGMAVAVLTLFAALPSAEADHLRRGFRATGVDLIDNATLAYHNGNLEAAIAGYTEAINRPRLSRTNRAIAYFDRGVAFSDLGDHGQAISDYDQAIDLLPEQAAFYNNRGNSFHQIGDNESAVLDYNEALSLDRRDPFVYYNRGSALTDLGATSQAIQDFNFALSLDPDLAIVYRGRGRTLRIVGSFESALADLDYSRILDPNMDIALNRAYVLLYLDRLAEAESEFQAKCALGCTMWEVLGRYVVRARQNNDASGQLARDIQRLDVRAWPGPVAQFLLGQMTEEQLINAALDSNPLVQQQQLTMSTYMIGQFHLANGDEDRAAAFFTETLNQRLPTWIQYSGAREELRRLGE